MASDERQNLTQELKKRFVPHAPFGDQPERYENIRRNAHSVAALMVKSCPVSRELSLALTKLEEAVFWANAAIARNEVSSPQSLPEWGAEKEEE